MFKAIAFQTLTQTINAALAADPNSAKRIAPLESSAIQLNITDINLTMFWVFEHGKVRIVGEWSHDITASISASLEALINMGLADDQSAAQLTVSGQLNKVEAFKTLFKELDIDWQTKLANVIGDSPTYAIESTLRTGRRWLKQATESIKQNSKEYAQYEIEAIPTRQQFSDFSTEIRDINRRVERLAARLQRLEQ